jgi:hypothetical protein
MKQTVALFTLIACAACGDAPPADSDAVVEDAAAEMSAEEASAEATLAALTARYADASAALADGFIRDPSGMCVTAESMGLPAADGAMGVHYIHPERLGLVPESAPVNGTDGQLAWDQPEVLVYEPQQDGSEKLVAVEYLVFQEPWRAAGNAGPPSFLDIPFFSMANDPATEQDEAHGFEPHHELHIWTPRENPAGRYAEFNPAVSCEFAPAPTMSME